MIKTSFLKKIISAAAILACFPVAADASFFGPDPLASYKHTEIENRDITPVIALLDTDTQAVLRKDKGKLEALVRKETVRSYLIAQAHKKKLDKQKQLALQMQVSAENELYRSYMTEQNKVPAGYPDQNQLNQVYNSNIKQFVVPEQVHLRQIFLVVNAKKTARKQMNEVSFMRSQIKRGRKTFAAYAKSHSDHKESANNGGDMGWSSINALLPEIRDAVKTMAGKKTLQIVTSPAGLHLIELLETRPSSTLPLTNVKQLLVAKMRLQKQGELENAYLADLRKKSPATINDFALLKNAINSDHREQFNASLNNVIASMGTVQLKLGDLLEKIEMLEGLQNNARLNTDDAFIKQTLIGNVLIKQFVIQRAKAAKWDERNDISLRMRRGADDVLVQAMLENLSEPSSKFPNKNQIQAAYEANKQKFMHPDQIHLAQIFIASTRDNEQSKKLDQGVRDLHKLLTQKPGSFAVLAKKYSQNQASKSNGGDMGWLNISTLVPAINDGVKKLQPDSISPVIKTEQGWHIIKLIERRAAGPIALAEVKPALIKALRATETKKLVEKNINTMLTDKSLSIDRDELEALAKSI